MTKRTGILVATLWTASIAAAFYVGHSLTATSPAAPGAHNGNSTPGSVVFPSASGQPGHSDPSGKSGGDPASASANSVGKVSYYANSAIPAEERMAKMIELEDPVQRMTAFLDLLKSLKTPEEFDAAATKMMEGPDGRSRGREFSMLMMVWAKQDPNSALAHTDKMGERGRWAEHTVLQTWAQSNPDAARAWAMEKGKNLKGDEGNRHMIGVIAGVAKNDLDLASQWAREQPRSEARGEMLELLVNGYFKNRGAEALQKWAETLPASNPTEIAFRETALRRAAERLMEKDPLVSANWIATLPNTGSKFGAMNELMEHWGERDPNAAGTWLKNFQPSAETDDSRRTFAWTIRERDPEAAVAWAGTMTNVRQRDRVMVDIVRDWYRRDPNAAQGYMQANAWPAESQQRVLTRERERDRNREGRG